MSRSRRQLAALAVGAVLVLFAGARAVNAWLYSDVVRRMPVEIGALPGYADELASINVWADSPSCSDPYGTPDGYSGPGKYPRRSPDGASVAFTQWGFPSSLPFGLFMDRPFIHTVGLLHTGSGAVTPIISIMEADPHSGIAHRYFWSSDSQALFILGSGGLPNYFRGAIKLCLVYLPQEDQLYRLVPCPEAQPVKRTVFGPCEGAVEREDAADEGAAHRE